MFCHFYTRGGSGCDVLAALLPDPLPGGPLPPGVPLGSSPLLKEEVWLAWELGMQTPSFCGPADDGAGLSTGPHTPFVGCFFSLLVTSPPCRRNGRRTFELSYSTAPVEVSVICLLSVARVLYCLRCIEDSHRLQIPRLWGLAFSILRRVRAANVLSRRLGIQL